MASKQNKTKRVRTYILSVQSHGQDKNKSWENTNECTVRTFQQFRWCFFFKSHIDYKNIAQRKRRLCVKKCIIMWDSHKLYTKPTKPMMFVFICCLSFFFSRINRLNLFGNFIWRSIHTSGKKHSICAFGCTNQTHSFKMHLILHSIASYYLAWLFLAWSDLEINYKLEFI